MAQAAGVLTIGRREDSTTFDPIKSAQNADNWVFSNVFDPLVRVDKAGRSWSRAWLKAGRFLRMARSTL
jgi:ABC-type transport system substrate-binding protein